jgi:hypothetical protein
MAKGNGENGSAARTMPAAPIKGGPPTNRSLPSRLFPTRPAQVIVGCSLMLAFALLTWGLYGTLLAGYRPPVIEYEIDSFAREALERADQLASDGEYDEALAAYNRVEMGWALNPSVMKVVNQKRRGLRERIAHIEEDRLAKHRQEALAALEERIRTEPGRYRTHLESIAELREEYPGLGDALDGIERNLETRAATALDELRNSVSTHIALSNLDSALEAINTFERDHPGHPDLEKTEELRQQVQRKAESMFGELERTVNTYLAEPPKQYVSATKACDRFLERVRYEPLREQAKALRAEVDSTLEEDFSAYIERVRSAIGRMDFTGARNALADGALTFDEAFGDEIRRYRRIIPVLKRLHQSVVRRISTSQPWAPPFMPTPMRELWDQYERILFTGADEREIRVKMKSGAGTTVHWEDLPSEELYRIYRHYLPWETNEAYKDDLDSFREYHEIE